MLNPRENMLRAIKRENPEYVPDGTRNIINIKCPTCERPIKAEYDIWGVKWDYEPSAEGGTYPAVGGNCLHDIENWREELKVPDIDKDVDWDYLTQNWEEAPLDVKNIDRENNVVMGLVEMGIFERLYLLFGMEEALMYFMTDPEEMFEIANIIAEWKVKVIKKFASVVKMDMIWYGDDWGNQRNSFLPPRVWREIIKPGTHRIYNCIHDLGLLINQHSCGKIENVFGDMVEMGADMWNMSQPCNDLKMLKETYGDKISFFGGFDSQFVLNRPGVTVDEVRAEVRKRVSELKGKNGYVAAPSHEVPYAPEIVAAMRDELQKVGRY